MSEAGRRMGIAMGFPEAAAAVGLSKSFLRNAADNPDPAKRLRTVRVARRRLIREEDLADWFDRVAVSDGPQAVTS